MECKKNTKTNERRIFNLKLKYIFKQSRKLIENDFIREALLNFYLQLPLCFALLKPFFTHHTTCNILKTLLIIPTF